MAQLEATAAFPAVSARYGGFWRRVVAWIIDWLIVSTCVSLALLALAAVIPGLGNLVTLSSPFGLLETTRVLETKSIDARTTERIVETTVAGKWTYLHRRTEIDKTDAKPSGGLQIKWQQLDPVTRQDITSTHMGTIVMLVLLVYWTLMEASRHQASFGKLALGMKVVDGRGGRLTIPQAAGRNLLKALSAITFFIGFMMAGWTARKQALHDKIVGCCVVMAR